jgi:hypothetical protein
MQIISKSYGFRSLIDHRFFARKNLLMLKKYKIVYVNHKFWWCWKIAEILQWNNGQKQINCQKGWVDFIIYFII